MFALFNFHAGSEGSVHAGVEGAVLAGVLSTQQMEKPSGCTAAWVRVILSALVSISTIVALSAIFVQQFSAVKNGRRLQRDRDSAIDAFLPNETEAEKRRRFPNYRKDVFEETSAFYWGAPSADKTYAYYWWAPRIAFLILLSAVSYGILVFCARLIC